jgi:ABC-type transport system involved in multi-copper enzyme maturation permease subunit
MSVTLEENLQAEFEKHPIGFKKSMIQVGATIEFETKRNFRNIFIAIGIAALFYFLGILINLIREGRGVELYDNAADYLKQSYLGFTFGFFILIIAVLFGSSIIAYDYDKQTGNLLFPKITKGRLFVGRFIARYFLAMLSILVYYTLIIITTFIKFGEYPVNVWFSLGWAVYYMLAVFALVVFFSSFLNKTSTVIVLSILMVLIVFNMSTTILNVTGSDIEPLFILTYYSNIVSEVITGIPSERYTEGRLMPGPGGEEGPTGFTWSTPNELGAAIGLLVYSIILIAAAYLLFRRRQQK